MIPYMTRHNASCIITKVSVILDYDAGIFFLYVFRLCSVPHQPVIIVDIILQGLRKRGA